MKSYNTLIINLLKDFLREVKVDWLRQPEEAPQVSQHPDRIMIRDYHGEYYGELKNGRPHNLGCYKYSSGETYIGYLDLGIRSGMGIMTNDLTLATLDSLEGLLNGNEGQGMEHPVSYIGQWQEGRRSGFGIQTWKDGDWYMGWWNADIRQGSGIYHSADDWIIDCDWETELPNWGKFKHKDGTEILIEGFSAEDKYLNFKPVLLTKELTQDDYGTYFFVSELFGMEFYLRGDPYKINTVAGLWVGETIPHDWGRLVKEARPFTRLSLTMDLSVPDHIKQAEPYWKQTEPNVVANQNPEPGDLAKDADGPMTRGIRNRKDTADSDNVEDMPF
jgi:hypothetical protein